MLPEENDWYQKYSEILVETPYERVPVAEGRLIKTLCELSGLYESIDPAVAKFFTVLYELLLENSRSYKTPFDGRLTSLINSEHEGALQNYLGANLCQMLHDVDQRKVSKSKAVKQTFHLAVIVAMGGKQPIWRQAILRLLGRWHAKISGISCDLEVKVDKRLYSVTSDPLQRDYWLQIRQRFGQCDHVHIIGFEIDTNHPRPIVRPDEGWRLSVAWDGAGSQQALFHPRTQKYTCNLWETTPRLLHFKDFMPFRVKIKKEDRNGLYIQNATGVPQEVEETVTLPVKIFVVYRDDMGINRSSPILITW